MPMDIVTIPCLSDNYAFLAHDTESGITALVDAPEAAPILSTLAARDWTLSHVLLTHHHWDHVDALPEILEAQPAQVIGAAADATRLPPLDQQVNDGDSFVLGNETVNVLDVSGHTIGHIAFHLPASHAVFTADSLMALGCGRLFEGTPDQMWDSLSRLAALPDDTIVYSGHEYTEANARFAVTVDPDNSALNKRIDDLTRLRAAGLASVPSSLALERATNPFLRATDPGVKAQVGFPADADPAQVFAEIRKRKDSF